MALIDRGEPPAVVGTIILDSMRNAGHDWGWLGLLGLSGLAGLLGRAGGNPRTDLVGTRATAAR
jgi:hypothetical protein